MFKVFQRLLILGIDTIKETICIHKKCIVFLINFNMVLFYMQLYLKNIYYYYLKTNSVYVELLLTPFSHWLPFCHCSGYYSLCDHTTSIYLVYYCVSNCIMCMIVLLRTLPIYPLFTSNPSLLITTSCGLFIDHVAAPCGITLNCHVDYCSVCIYYSPFKFAFIQ